VRCGEEVAWGPLGEGSGEPTPQKIFRIFVVENTISRRILSRLFLKSYANGRGSNPLTLSSVRHWPNTHRRRRRDSTVELSHVGVGVGGVNRIRSSRRLPTDSVDNNFGN